MSPVVSIDGGEVAYGQPAEGLVERLEEILAAARAGEIQEVIYACIHADEACSYGSAGNTISKFALAGAAREAVDLYMRDRRST